MPTKLFVYGLLRPGYSLHTKISHFVLDAKPYTFSGLKLFTISSGLTYVVESDNLDDTVDGFLLDFADDSVFEITDPLEGFKGFDNISNFYERKLINGTWVYLGGSLLQRQNQ